MIRVVYQEIKFLYLIKRRLKKKYIFKVMIKKYRLILILCSLSFMFSCERNNKIQVLKQEVKCENWDIVVVNHKYRNREIKEKVIISECENTFLYSKLIVDEEYFKKHGKFEGYSYKIIYESKELDTLKSLFKKVINNPVNCQSVSCYAGFSVSFSNTFLSNPQITCLYSNVDNWTKISPEISKIYSMTFDRVYKKDRIKLMKN